MNKYCWPRWMVSLTPSKTGQCRCIAKNSLVELFLYFLCVIFLCVFKMASLARTKFICTMDDDITLSDSGVIHDMFTFAENEHNEHQILGFTGTVFHPDTKETYQNGFHVSASKFCWSQAHCLKWQEGIVYEKEEEKKEEEVEGRKGGGEMKKMEMKQINKPWHSTPKWIWEKFKSDTKKNNSGVDGAGSSSNERAASSVKVDIIKGRMMFLHANALRRVSFAFDVNDIRGDDIAISGMVGQGQLGQHRVLRLLDQRILELPSPHALCSTPGASHYSRRDAVRRRFFDMNPDEGGESC